MVMLFKHWKISILVEGEKELALIQRFPELSDLDVSEIDRSYDPYPVDITLPPKLTLFRACVVYCRLSKMSIYSMIYKA